MWKSVLVCLALSQLASALDNGLGLTPPMGWLSWERFRCQTDCVNHPDDCISEKLIKQMADLMVSEGFKDAGYEYVNIDDCWPAKERDANGKLVADPVRFPSGMKALADYIHSKGLKFGIYEDFGHLTCGGYPGSEYYLQTDAETFAEWGVDFLKFDGCNSDPHDMPFGYPAMTKFLNMTGRPIMYNCQWPMYMVGAGLQPNMSAVRENCNLWRVFGDIEDYWGSISMYLGIIAGNNGAFRAVTGPGGWVDPDMLVVGNYGLSYYQQRLQMGMWCMWASPLFMSTDLRDLSAEAKAILLNKNYIAINQDPLGEMAQVVYQKNPKNGFHFQVWTKQLSRPTTGTVAIALASGINGNKWTLGSVSLQQWGLSNSNGYSVIDAWDNKPVQTGKFSLSQEFNVTITPASIQIWIATPL